MRHVPVLAGIMLLGGCTLPDDPGNVPLRGHWESAFRLVALTIDDRSITRDEAPFALPADKTEDKGCFEPRIKTVDEANSTMGSASKVNCHFESLDRDGGQIVGRGRCEPQAKQGVTINGTFTVTGEEAADRIKAIPSIDAFAHLPDGQTVRVHTAFALTFTRLGDCGA